MSETATPREPVGVTRPHVDYSALDRVVDLEDDQVIADHPPEHVLETLRLWVNFE